MVTNSTLNCGTGLTHPGVFVLVEYRLVDGQTAGEWQLLDTVTMEPTGTGCYELEMNVTDSNGTNRNDCVQLRIVQPEHGGGFCNCWGVKELVINTSISSTTLELNDHLSNPGCPITAQLTDYNESCPVQFCGGSASVPRGVVYPPVSLTGHIQNCSNRSTVVDTHGSPPTNCTSDELRLEISFELDLNLSHPCENPDNFYEGVELSVGNWNRDGNWIPLHYFANSEILPINSTIKIGRVNRRNFTVEIRGYTVPYTIQNATSLSFNLSVCGGILRDGLQIRWLQSTVVQNNGSRDLFLLGNVSVHLVCSEGSSFAKEELGWMRDLKLRNSEMVLNQSCSTMPFDSDAFLFGANCTTSNCEVAEQIMVVSRIVTTGPLNASNISCYAEEMSTRASIVKPTSESIHPSQTVFSNHPSSSVKHMASDLATTQFPTSLILSTDSPRPTPMPNSSSSVETYEAMERNKLATVTFNIQSTILSNAVLASIEEKPPLEAVQTLAVNVSGIYETVAVYLLSEVLSQKTEFNSTEEFIQKVLEVINGLIAKTITNSEPSTIAGSTLLFITEQLAFSKLSFTKKRCSLSKENIELMVFDHEVDTEEMYFAGIDTRKSAVRVPTRPVKMVRNGTEPVSVASAFYNNMAGLLPGTLPGGNDSILASPVLSTSLKCGNKICDRLETESSQPVIITLLHTIYVQNLIEHDEKSNVTCVFWKFITDSNSLLVSGRWDTDGCVKNDNLSNSTQTVCECRHLTNFAILLSARPILDPVNSFVLGVIGYIGVALSLAAMLCTVGALAFLRSLWNMRNFVHINLCVSLILAQLTFVIGVTPHGGGEGVGSGCRTAAVIMHYLFLVSFMWMLMEGVVLYVALVRVFVKHQKRYMIGFFVFSYGAPLLYMALCVPLGLAVPHESGYGYGYIQAANETADTRKTVCWLNPYSDFVWTYTVPVLVVILMNSGFFVMALVIMYRHAKRQDHKLKVQKAWYWLKSSVSLVTIMGLTWIIGILVFEGVAIFVIFVLLSKQVREAYWKWWKVKVAESDILSKCFGGWSSTKGLTSAAVGGNGAHTHEPVSPNTTTNPYILESSLSKAGLQSPVSADHCPLSESAVDSIEPGDQTDGLKSVSLSHIEENGSTFDVTLITDSGKDIQQDLASKQGASSEQ